MKGEEAYISLINKVNCATFTCQAEMSKHFIPLLFLRRKRER
jgi:hypothetical protein